MGVTIVKDRYPDLVRAIKALTKQVVMVGVPDETADRKPVDGAKGEITNAALAYIHEHGAPERNIPARPFMVPGIENAKESIVKQLRAAGEAALDGASASAINRALKAVGLTAQKAIQAKITDGPFAPIKEETAAARLRRKAGYKRASEKRKGIMMAQWLEGDFTPLVDTGALRQSIKFVIRNKSR